MDVEIFFAVEDVEGQLAVGQVEIEFNAVDVECFTQSDFLIAEDHETVEFGDTFHKDVLIAERCSIADFHVDVSFSIGKDTVFADGDKGSVEGVKVSTHGQGAAALDGFSCHDSTVSKDQHIVTAIQEVDSGDFDAAVNTEGIGTAGQSDLCGGDSVNCDESKAIHGTESDLFSFEAAVTGDVFNVTGTGQVDTAGGNQIFDAAVTIQIDTGTGHTDSPLKFGIFKNDFHSGIFKDQIVGVIDTADGQFFSTGNCTGFDDLFK